MLNLKLNNDDFFIINKYFIYDWNVYLIKDFQSFCDAYLIDDDFINQFKEALLKHDYHQNLDELISHYHPYVRMFIAEIGEDKHRDILVNDSFPFVRCNVARYGNDSHRDILVNDNDEDVCYLVARYGNHNHRLKLLRHHSEQVRNIAYEYSSLSEEYLYGKV